MIAPEPHGRYLGYWRLTGPYCRRKFGQRVWCHVQVVDPTQPVGDEDFNSMASELEKQKLALEVGETDVLDSNQQPHKRETPLQVVEDGARDESPQVDPSIIANQTAKSSANAATSKEA